MLTNADRKIYRSLSVKKFRDEHRLFLVEGKRSVQEAISSDFEIKLILATAAFLKDPDGRSIIAGAKKRKAKTEEMSEREFSALADTVHAQGIAAIVETKRASFPGILARDRPGALLVALDAVADPGNVGTIIRTCDWFGVDGIILGEGCADLYNPKVVRGTMGSVFHLPVAEGVNLEKSLPLARDAGYRVLATDAASHDQLPADQRKSILVFGNEAHGISKVVRALCDRSIAIPRYGRAESLNVSIACGVLLAQLRSHA